MSLALCVPVLLQAERDSGQYVIIGEVRELLLAGEAVLTRSTAILGSSEELARARISDGSFEIRAEFDHGGRVSLGFYDNEDDFKGSARFILEPAQIQVSYVGGVSTFQVRGGPYHQRVIESWELSEAYLAAKRDYAEVMDAKQKLSEGDEGYQQLLDLAWERYQALNEVRREALLRIAEFEDDSLASLYAVELGAMSGAEAIARLDELSDALGDHPTLIATRSRMVKGMQMQDAYDAMSEGSQVEDFSSVGLDGQRYRLQHSLDANRYVLIEFWASWCAPCREMNPELIASYETYRTRGFEVFAFSLDDDREDWELASIEDEIPWINTSDLKAYDSEVPTQFGVLAIPMNFLVNRQGVVVAKSLQGEALDEQLIELFD